MRVIDKKTKAICCGTGILVVLIIVLTIYSTISRNYEVAEYFIVGVAIAVFGTILISSLAYFITGTIKLDEKKKNISQEIAIKKKALPIYSRDTFFCCIVFYIVWFILFVRDWKKFFIEHFWIYAIISLFAAIIFYIKFRQSKMLYLYKDNPKVLNYSDNIDNLWKIFDLYRYIRGGVIKEFFITKKCECIELYNNIEFLSCFSKERVHSTSIKHSNTTYYYSYIFAIAKYDNEKDVNIVLNNSSSTYLHKENIYISRYSNLPPFIISGEISENICKNVEESCSDFFAKTRSKYVLIIKDGTIGLGLKSARFGKINRIFNKDETVRLTDEAINEISDFLIQIRYNIEKYQ